MIKIKVIFYLKRLKILFIDSADISKIYIAQNFRFCKQYSLRLLALKEHFFKT